MMNKILKQLRAILVSFLFFTQGFAQTGWMTFEGSGNVEIIVTDPEGRKVGYDPIRDTRFNDIPNAQFGGSGGADTHLDDGTTEEDPEQPTWGLDIDEPIEGQYTVTLIGLKSDRQGVSIAAKHATGPITNTVQAGLVDSLGSLTLLFNYKYAHRDSSSIEKVVEPGSLLKDIDLSYSMGYFANQGIYNSLKKKAENAIKKYDKGQANAAINQLEAFINAVEAQRGKHIKVWAADKLLTYDAEKLIEQW